VKHPVLFGAAPLGAGSGEAEALSGFFARISLCRFLKPSYALRHFVLPRMTHRLPHDQPSVSLGPLVSHANRIDLRPDIALPFASVLEELTALPSLGRHMFAVTAHLWPSHYRFSLGTPQKKWCPVCLAGSAGGTVYEQLVWRFALVERCPLHLCRLVDRCSVCGERQRLLPRCVPIGYCDCCGHRLVDGDPGLPIEEKELDVRERWALWRSIAISRLVAWSSRCDPSELKVDFRGYARLLQSVSTAAPHSGTPSRLGLEIALGLTGPAAFEQGLAGSAPSLEAIVDVSMQLGVDPVRVLSGQFRSGERTWPPKDTSLLPCEDPWTLGVQVRNLSTTLRHRESRFSEHSAESSPRLVD